MLVNVLSPWILISFPTASIIRLLAWCGTSQSTCSISSWFRSSIFLQALLIDCTACLNTTLPSCRKYLRLSVNVLSLEGYNEPPPSIFKNSRPSPLLCIKASMTPASADGSSQTTPAPSPKRILVERSWILTNALILSAPTTNTFLYRSVSTNDAPISSAYRKPEQAAFISKAHTFFISNF